jgi:CheY-like chemotaxis protein
LAKVLIVEDEASLLQLLEMVVADLGHAVLTAGQGAEALAVIAREQPELVISDVMMPVMDGYSLLREIRVRPEWSKVKVVLISAAPIDHLYPPPADEYVSKPYNLAAIEELLERLTVK